MAIKDRIGIHLHLDKTYRQTIQKALEMNVTRFQYFLVSQKEKNYLPLDEEDCTHFLKHHAHFQETYIHSSYWVNLASGDPHVRNVSKKLFAKELSMAQKLNATNLILHPGSARKFPSKLSLPQKRTAGINTLLESINSLLQESSENKTTILIENSPHGGATIGGDLDDFKYMRKLMKNANRVGFCLDTAHAYVYGYPLEQTDDFVAQLDRTMGIENIKLIHLNDSKEKCGSRIDFHAPPGLGHIGKEKLLALINHPELKHIPIIVELPNTHIQQASTIIEDIWTW